MKQTYFTDRGDLTDDEAAALAVRQVQAMEDLDAKHQEARRNSDDERRKADLALGEIIALAPHPDTVIERVAANSTFTKGSLRERLEVYKRSVDEGVMDALLGMPLSYTGHRTIVGLRNKQRRGLPVAGMDQRIEAARRSIERNGGSFKGDDEFFRDSNLLPPPNTFERVLERMEQDTEFRDEKLNSVTASRMSAVLNQHSRDRIDPKPLPPTPQPEPGEVLAFLLNEVDRTIRTLAEADVPNEMAGLVVAHTEANIALLSNVITIMRGKEALTSL